MQCAYLPQHIVSLEVHGTKWGKEGLRFEKSMSFLNGFLKLSMWSKSIIYLYLMQRHLRLLRRFLDQSVKCLTINYGLHNMTKLDLIWCIKLHHCFVCKSHLINLPNGTTIIKLSVSGKSLHALIHKRTKKD